MHVLFHVCIHVYILCVLFLYVYTHSLVFYFLLCMCLFVCLYMSHLNSCVFSHIMPLVYVLIVSPLPLCLYTLCVYILCIMHALLVLMHSSRTDWDQMEARRWMPHLAPRYLPLPPPHTPACLLLLPTLPPTTTPTPRTPCLYLLSLPSAPCPRDPTPTVPLLPPHTCLLTPPLPPTILTPCPHPQAPFRPTLDWTGTGTD